MALIVDIKVVPSASSAKIILHKTQGLTAHVKSPPEDGKANRELIKLFAKSLGITQQDIVLVAGATSRKKKLKITGFLTLQELLQALELDVQNSII